MDAIALSFKDHHAVIELGRPKAHAINREMVDDLREALASLSQADYIRGAILTAQGDIFSAGLDVVELYAYDEEQMDRFWEAFGQLMRDMVAFPKPLIAAINGHSPAGGCVLALCTDHRIMAGGKFRIGLNEVPVGVVAPGPVVELAAYCMGHGKASKMLLNGLLMTGEEALDFGLVDATCPQEEVLLRAEEKLAEWFAYPDTPWRKTKEILRRPLVEALSKGAQEAFGETARAWWSHESRSAMGKFVETLTSKSN